MLGAAALDSLLNRGAAPRDARYRMVATARGVLRVLDSGGSGPVVLSTPDGPNVIEHHAALIARLAPHARVIAFDMPGFGWSRPRWSYGHGVDEGASVVLALMDALDVHEATLAFSCANGFYAIAAARQQPVRVRRLVLAQTPSMNAMRAWTRRMMPWPVRTPLLGQALMRATRRKLAHDWYKLALPDREKRPAFQGVADEALRHGGCFCLAGVVQGLSRARNAQLEGVKSPATLLWGDADRSHRPEEGATRFSNAPYVTGTG